MKKNLVKFLLVCIICLAVITGIVLLVQYFSN
jgi:hypothetical protein